MIIGISGAHCTGKTTLVEALKQSNDLKDFTFKSGLTRDLHKLGVPINESGTDVTQLYVMTKHYEYAQLSGKVVLDRCALDGIAYSKVVLKQSSNETIKTVIGILGRMCYAQYHTIFYIRPEIKLVDDGVRSTNVEFHNEIIKSFEDSISMVKDYVNIVEIGGTVEQRVGIILNYLKTNKLN